MEKASSPHLPSPSLFPLFPGAHRSSHTRSWLLPRPALPPPGSSASSRRGRSPSPVRGDFARRCAPRLFDSFNPPRNARSLDLSTAAARGLGVRTRRRNPLDTAAGRAVGVTRSAVTESPRRPAAQSRRPAGPPREEGRRGLPRVSPAAAAEPPARGLPPGPRPITGTTPQHRDSTARTYLRVAADAGFRQARRPGNTIPPSGGTAHRPRPASVSPSPNGKRRSRGAGPGSGASRWRHLWAPLVPESRRLPGNPAHVLLVTFPHPTQVSAVWGLGDPGCGYLGLERVEDACWFLRRFVPNINLYKL